MSVQSPRAYWLNAAIGVMHETAVPGVSCVESHFEREAQNENSNDQTGNGNNENRRKRCVIPDAEVKSQ
jgi:hypothetical protein